MRPGLSLIIMAASRLIYSRAFTSLPSMMGTRRPPSLPWLSSSHFRDADSSSSYDALRDELASGEFSDSGGGSSASATASSPDVGGLLNKAIGRAFSTLDAASTAKIGDEADAVVKKQVAKKHVDKRTYLSNPNVTPTALAHSLWRETIIPGVDTVIDATCGNGKDSVALAEILFDPTLACGDGWESTDSNEELAQPELLCIDIQSRAAANTTEALREVVDSNTFENHCRILGGTSHAPLPQPHNSQSVGLICYNLGWLPGSSPDDKSAFATKMVTTMYSLTDAALMLRVGGLLSVMTYPGTTPLEADAVRYFAEGLAMLTTRDPAGWQGYVDAIPPDADGSGATAVRDAVRTSLERVVQAGVPKQTWRAYEHKPLGRPLSPILITAMRIK